MRISKMAAPKEPLRKSDPVTGRKVCPKCARLMGQRKELSIELGIINLYWLCGCGYLHEAGVMVI
jgi:hypothetical protein